MGFNYNVLPTCYCSNVAETSISLAGLNPTGAALGAADVIPVHRESKKQSSAGK